MKTLWCVLGAVGAWGMIAHCALAQLPADVEASYLRYVQSLEAGEARAAAAAAHDTWIAAQGADIEPDTLRALGTNAVNAYWDLEDWQVLAELAPEVARLHDRFEEDEEETAFLLVSLTLQAADRVGDHVAYGQALPWGLRLAARHGHAHRSWTEGMLVPDPPGARGEFASLSTPQLAAVVEDMLAGGAADQRRLTNAAVTLIDRHVEDEMFDSAWTRLEQAVQALAEDEATGLSVYQHVLFSRASPLLTRGFDDHSSGADRFGPAIRGLWCDYLQTTPTVLDPGVEVQFPMRPMVNGNRYAVVETELSVPAAGGQAAIVQMQYEGREQDEYFRSVTEAIEASRFRPQCRPDQADYRVRRVDLFGLAELNEGRGRVRFTARGRVETAYFTYRTLGD